MSSFVSKRTLMDEAKKRGLKAFSTMTKGAIQNLLKLDDSGQAPARHMTAKRKKQLSKVGSSGLSFEEEQNYMENPLLGLNPLATELLQRPPPFTRPTTLKLKRKARKKRPKPQREATEEKYPATIKIKIKKKPKNIKVKIKPSVTRLSASDKAKLLSMGSSRSSSSAPSGDYWKSVSGQNITNMLENSTKAQLIKIARSRKARECKPFANLQKKSVAQLKALL